MILNYPTVVFAVARILSTENDGTIIHVVEFCSIKSGEGVIRERTYYSSMEEHRSVDVCGHTRGYTG